MCASMLVCVHANGYICAFCALNPKPGPQAFWNSEG